MLMRVRRLWLVVWRMGWLGCVGPRESGEVASWVSCPRCPSRGAVGTCPPVRCSVREVEPAAAVCRGSPGRENDVAEMETDGRDCVLDGRPPGRRAAVAGRESLRN